MTDSDPIVSYRIWQIIRDNAGEIRFQGNAFGLGHSYARLEDALPVARDMARQVRGDEELYIVTVHERSGGDWENMRRIHPEQEAR